MNLLNKVYSTLKWKKSDEYCAEKLGIGLSHYKKLKSKVLHLDRTEIEDLPTKEKIFEFKEDLEAGTAEIKGMALSEPRSPEEIIKLLKIDTKRWKLSNYWNKETGGGKWVVSALVTLIKKESVDHLAEVIKNFKPSYKPVDKVFTNQKFSEKVAAVLSVQDLHFGKEGNADIVQNFKLAIENLIHRAFLVHNLDEVVYVFGGDILNMDTFNGTTTSGTPVDNEQRAQDAYKDAFDALYWSVKFVKQFCNKLTVVYVPGNHDRLSSYHLAHALEKCFNEPRITFKTDYSERKVVTYGLNFFAFEHGDVTKKNTPLVYATEFPTEWGNTTYRTCYTGHFHSKKTTEYITENEHNGFSIKHLPSLCSTDYWHYHNKYIGSKRQAVIECHSENYGKLSEFIYTV
jgi:hypothetical protein